VKPPSETRYLDQISGLGLKISLTTALLRRRRPRRPACIPAWNRVVAPSRAITSAVLRSRFAGRLRAAWRSCRRWRQLLSGGAAAVARRGRVPVPTLPKLRRPSVDMALPPLVASRWRGTSLPLAAAVSGCASGHRLALSLRGGRGPVPCCPNPSRTAELHRLRGW